MSTKYLICVIGGDGIGSEVTEETCRLLQATGVSFSFQKELAGFDCFKQLGSSLPDTTIASCKAASAILFGAVTTPPNIPNYTSPIIHLRKSLGLYANLRPIISLPISGSRPNLNFYIVRENTEDLYTGQEEEIADGFMAKRVITRKASAKIIRFAFELAIKKHKNLVTVVHKANVLRKTDGLFLSIAQEIARDYPQITMEDILVDTAAMRLIKEPEHFQILVTTNMFGDILSDEASALIGGLGVAASANIGEQYALFEPVHGSAPKYAGKNIANPLASFMAGVMLLEYLGENDIAARVSRAIEDSIKSGCTTRDLGGANSTSEVTDMVIKYYNKS